MDVESLIFCSKTLFVQMLQDMWLSKDRPEEHGWLAWLESSLARVSDACQAKEKKRKQNTEIESY